MQVHQVMQLCMHRMGLAFAPVRRLFDKTFRGRHRAILGQQVSGTL